MDELYDLQEDPSELNNLIENPDYTNALANKKKTSKEVGEYWR